MSDKSDNHCIGSLVSDSNGLVNGDNCNISVTPSTIILVFNSFFVNMVYEYLWGAKWITEISLYIVGKSSFDIQIHLDNKLRLWARSRSGHGFEIKSLSHMVYMYIYIYICLCEYKASKKSDVKLIYLDSKEG